MRASRRARRIPRATLALALLAIVLTGCKPPSLPDASSPGAQLYVERCGNCHAPYNPHEMTASMWDTQVTMMDVKIQAAGMPPLTSDERESILEYLKHNAGTE
jgi:mono/diheme cytochrome c family protein